MIFFDSLFGESKRIYRRDFNKALKNLPTISRDERKYLNQVFKKDLGDGLTGYELKKRIQQLRHNTTDSLKPYEVEQIKKKLRGEINK